MSLPSSDFSFELYSGASRGLSGKSAQVFEELERRIIHGAYPFGSVIPTAQIAEEFSISRAPLYAALSQLKFNGYIETTPQVGSRVITPTEQQMWDFFEMFSIVEGQMARFAAARRTPQEAESIARICTLLTEVSAPLAAPTEHYLDTVDLYHMAVRQAAHSPLEVRRVRGYFRYAAFLLMNGWPADFAFLRDNSNTHRPRVTEAIVEGDVAKAGAAARDYIPFRFTS